MTEKVYLFKFAVFGIALLAYVLFISYIIFKENWKNVKKLGVFFWLIACGFLYSMATKPPAPEITWGAGVHNNGTHFDTNTWKSIYFRWTKDSTIPASNEIYFATKRRGIPDIDWQEIGSALAGAGTFDYTFSGNENATNFLYYVFTGVVPVHTNGTWTARIMRPAMGGAGVDKIVVLEGKIEENGKQLAPFKE